MKPQTKLELAQKEAKTFKVVENLRDSNFLIKEVIASGRVRERAD